MNIEINHLSHKYEVRKMSEKDYAYIGFVMMNFKFQGQGIGSEIISEVVEYLKKIVINSYV